MFCFLFLRLEDFFFFFTSGQRSVGALCMLSSSDELCGVISPLCNRDINKSPLCYVKGAVCKNFYVNCFLLSLCKQLVTKLPRLPRLSMKACRLILCVFSKFLPGQSKGCDVYVRS